MQIAVAAAACRWWCKQNSCMLHHVPNKCRPRLCGNDFVSPVQSIKDCKIVEGLPAANGFGFDGVHNVGMLLPARRP
jgi:hypothetical protein